MGIRPSMGTVGDAYDNAMAESVFASLECELIERLSFKTKATGGPDWIDARYNPRRRPSAQGRISPVNFERMQAGEASPTAYRPTRVVHCRPVRGWRHAGRGQPCADAHRDLRTKSSSVRENGASPV